MDLPNPVRAIALGLKSPRNLVAQVARIYYFAVAYIIPRFALKIYKINSLGEFSFRKTKGKGTFRTSLVSWLIVASHVSAFCRFVSVLIQEASSRADDRARASYFQVSSCPHKADLYRPAGNELLIGQLGGCILFSRCGIKRAASSPKAAVEFDKVIDSGSGSFYLSEPFHFASHFTPPKIAKPTNQRGLLRLIHRLCFGKLFRRLIG
jgi:hypothetical protein